MGQVWLGQEGLGFRLDLVGIDQSSDLYGHDVLKFRVGLPGWIRVQVRIIRVYIWFDQHGPEGSK